jgi:hypothetical protein
MLFCVMLTLFFYHFKSCLGFLPFTDPCSCFDAALYILQEDAILFYLHWEIVLVLTLNLCLSKLTGPSSCSYGLHPELAVLFLKLFILLRWLFIQPFEVAFHMISGSYWTHCFHLRCFLNIVCAAQCQLYGVCSAPGPSRWLMPFTE